VFNDKRRIAIISYHSISHDSNRYIITPETFTSQMEFIRENYQIIRLNRIRDAFFDGEKDATKIIITFDDGFKNFFEFAYPTLKKLSIPSTIFIPTGFIGSSNLWDMHKNFYTKINIMNSKQLLALSQECLVDFGSHTVSHLSMRNLCAEKMMREAVDSKKKLEDLFGFGINMFAYPYGQLDDISGETTRTLLDAGYEIAVTSRWGTLQSLNGMLKLKRIFFKEKDSYDDLRTKIEGQYDWFAFKERIGFTFRFGRKQFKVQELQKRVKGLKNMIWF